MMHSRRLLHSALGAARSARSLAVNVRGRTVAAVAAVSAGAGLAFASGQTSCSSDREYQEALKMLEAHFEGRDAATAPGPVATATSSEVTGADFKALLHQGEPKFGIFVNSASPTVAEHVASCGYDWVLVDTQHGPMDPVLLSSMLCAIAKGGAKSMVRVAAYNDRSGIQQALDLGADGIIVPYVNNVAEVKHAVSCAMYPTKGTRSVYFPQRSMFEKGLLGYAGNSNKNVIIAMQIETADSIKNMEEISAVDGVDMLFLGRNDLCMSMGLYEKYEFPDMYSSPELQAATTKLIINAKKNNKLLGLFLFGTERVGKFLDDGFTFVSVGNDLHHILTSASGHIASLENMTEDKGVTWKHRESGLVP